jgi:carbonic anhydrase/acetyltransferase-like protein (isoleucine patch superfamily)
MPIILPFEGREPKIGRNVYLADNAVVVGDVEIDDEASVWFGCVLRGDVGPIRVGARSNVQDLSCLHATGGVSRVVIGREVTVGHGCILHGCVLGDRVLVGMGSILLDNAEVGDDSVIGAGTLVTARMRVPPRSTVMGRPGKVVRDATEAEMRLGPDGAANYLGLSRLYAASRGRAL